MFLCAECKQPVALMEECPEKGEAGSFLFSCPMCGHRWTALDEPDDNDLIEWFANVYVPTSMTAEGAADNVARGAEPFAHNRGWNRREIQEFVKKVRTRVMWKVGRSSARDT